MMTIKRTRWLSLVLALTTSMALLMPGSALALPAGFSKIGMVCTPGTVVGLIHTFNLVAKTGVIHTPDGNTVFMWSYANGDAPDNGSFQYPGPVLCVTQDETVVVNLTNPTAFTGGVPEATSIIFPGQDAQVTATGGIAGLLTTEATASGGTVSYSFVAGSPGTYLYESGSNISKQVEMGLYGALVVRPSLGAGYAYDGTTQFNTSREYLLLLSEVDPDLHHALDPAGTGGVYDFTALHNRYFMINGRAFPDTLQDNGTVLLPTQPYGSLVRLQPNTTPSNLPTLIRMINAGTLNHPFHPHGNHTTQIAQDGRLVARTEHFGETIGSGQTEDYLIRWDDVDNWNPTTNQLPVAQPNYKNLTFKDSNTNYSGNPYLGYKGTLPTGTVSQNICGEWYFPWHSHALNEFANFDEPFGGMATLLRVDPAGGCFTFPASSKITLGTLRSGTVANLGVDDANYYRVNSTTTGTQTTDWYGQFSSVPAGATNFVVTYKGRNCGTAPTPACPPLSGTNPTTLSLWNWGTSTWFSLAATSIGTTEVTMTSASIPSPAVYIGTGANKGLVRVRVLTTRADTTNFVTGGNLMKLVYDAP